MNSLRIDLERFAYDVFRINCIKCNVPRNEIPFYQHVENAYPIGFIRSIAKYVMFYQVLIRNDINHYMEEVGSVNIDDECSMFDFFNRFMRLDKDYFIYQIMQNVVCSMAICLELTLYEYPLHRRLLGHISGSWKTYFQRYLQLDFFLNGGFEDLYKHTESMHANNYTLDKYIYESNRVVLNNGSNIWTTSHVPTFLKANNIKIDRKIRFSTVSLLNRRSMNANSRFSIGSEMLLNVYEKLPIVGKWIRWTRKRVQSIGSILFNRRSKQKENIGSFFFPKSPQVDKKLIDSSSESDSSDDLTECLQKDAEDDEVEITSMIENYIKSVHSYKREDLDEINCRNCMSNK